MEKFCPITQEHFVHKQDGTGWVDVFFEAERLLFAQIKLDVGCQLNRDIHPAGEEGYYVLSGELTVTLPEHGVKQKVSVGQVFYVPSNTYHLVSNEGCTPVHVIAAIGGKA